jgi:predicted TIM-barrel fold metal-dependent hydrolase
LGWDYPFPQAHKLIKQQYEEFGAHKLIWGSDMPNVERHCTYRQSVSYLKDYCDFIGHEDMDLILGGNLARILKIPTTEVPRTLLAGRLVAMA